MSVICMNNYGEEITLKLVLEKWFLINAAGYSSRDRDTDLSKEDSMNSGEG